MNQPQFKQMLVEIAEVNALSAGAVVGGKGGC
jgi:hypothetical protein